MRIGVVIPARDEVETIAQVVDDCLTSCSDRAEVRIIVSDNGSQDGTAAAAEGSGAEVVHEPRRGYGSACMKACAHLGSWPNIILFIDGDGSSTAADMAHVLGPLVSSSADLVLGWRQQVEPGAMPAAQRFGNWLICALMRCGGFGTWRDCGPLRAIRRSALEDLNMQDRTWGWNIEMHIKACLHGLRVMEVPVSWRRRRGGASKISGTVSGVVKAGSKILWTFVKLAVRHRSRLPCGPSVVMAFIKYPRPGQVKTRLAQALGTQQAARIYTRMAESTHRVLINLQEGGDCRSALVTTGEAVPAFQSWLPGMDHYWPQAEGDLGARLTAAFKAAFASGARHVAAVGSDCPGMNRRIVLLALQSLKHADVGIVPTTDGGYALIALKQLNAALFERIDWSSSRVLEQTLAAADAHGLRVELLAPLADVDTADDLVHLQDDAAG